MNTTRVPNGNLLVIKGGVFNINEEEGEPPMVMPTLNFSKEQVQTNAEDDDEAPLVMPKMF